MLPAPDTTAKDLGRWKRVECAGGVLRVAVNVVVLRLVTHRVNWKIQGGWKEERKSI